MFRLDDVENALEQMSQACGLSPVWVRRCRFSKDGRSKHLLQKSQGSMRLLLLLLLLLRFTFDPYLLKTTIVIIKDNNQILVEFFACRYLMLQNVILFPIAIFMYIPFSTNIYFTMFRVK